MILLICLAAASILSFVYFVAFTDKSLSDFARSLLAMSAIIMFGLFILLVIKISKPNKPTAMDVYRGKTTLEITYKNNIPIDSVVVYK